jgi:hypothetical protein
MGLIGVRRATIAVIAVAITVTACGNGRATLGPLSIRIPPGWRVTSFGGDNLQIANGTSGGEEGSTPGTATAVFDLYTNSTVKPSEYVKDLREQNVGVTTEDITVDGYDAVRLSYEGAAVAGRQEAVFIPARDVRIVYRAAYPEDNGAFEHGLDDFRSAMRSLRFEDRPRERA